MTNDKPVAGEEPPVAARKPLWRRLLPLGVLLAAVGLAFGFDLHHYLSFATLEAHQQTLLAFVDERPLATALVFIAIYAGSVAVSLPGAAILTITGGFLFGVWLGSLLAVTGATIGAVGVFLVAKTSLGDSLKARAGPWLRRMQDGFNENAVNYLLVLRLIPLFPFWIVNVVPAFLGVRLRDYMLATLLGIIPGSLVYASVGNGLGAVLAAGDEPDLGLILQPAVLGPILGLAALALLPVVYRKVKARRVAGT
jgi:uncharacterized membrane protein YdjX (TVP38/TMEM64 family)